VSTLTRLQPGMVILSAGIRYRVELVNESRAFCVPTEKRTEVFQPKTGKNAGAELVIEKRQPGISISPNAECEIVEWPRGEAA
jgi:hypothetical protein